MAQGGECPDDLPTPSRSQVSNHGRLFSSEIFCNFEVLLRWSNQEKLYQNVSMSPTRACSCLSLSSGPSSLHSKIITCSFASFQTVNLFLAS